MGHLAGDELLKMIARRLKESIRDQDLLARIGGDEFVVLLQEGNEKELTPIAERVANCVKEPFSLDGQLISISLSLGISIYPDHGGDMDTLLTKADRAMYAAKQRGNNQIELFDNSRNY